MRQRMISPSFFVDEGLVTLDPLTRLLFIGLWTLADREGRLEDRPVRIKMQLFPCDDCDVDVMLLKLASIGVITRYVTDTNIPVIEVTNFAKHQHPHHREAPSKYPAPAQGKPKASPRQALGKPYTSPSDYGIRNKTSPSSGDEEFRHFWSAYPRKVGKKDALKAWVKATKDAKPDDIIAKVKEYPFDLRDGMKFVPHPATWLNQGRWEDEVVPFLPDADDELGYYR